jgi:hypothetical protein
MFEDWRYRWSRLCKSGNRWVVLTHHVEREGWPNGYPITRPIRWWSPRDLIRFPLHEWWERRYW